MLLLDKKRIQTASIHSRSVSETVQKGVESSNKKDQSARCSSLHQAGKHNSKGSYDFWLASINHILHSLSKA